jgi:deoxyhypusine synthase
MVQNDGEHGWCYEYCRDWKIFIRQDKVHIISCTGANLEEDIMNLVAHSHYERVPNYRDLTLKTNGIY